MKESGIVEGAIGRHPKNRKIFSVVMNGGKDSFTRYELINSFLPFSLVKLYPKTGRTHQLRVQCAKRNLPIVGDNTYGDFQLNREIRKSTGYKRLFLHASHIRIPLNDVGRRVYFEANLPIPTEFHKLLINN